MPCSSGRNGWVEAGVWADSAGTLRLVASGAIGIEADAPRASAKDDGVATSDHPLLFCPVAVGSVVVQVAVVTIGAWLVDAVAGIGSVVFSITLAGCIVRGIVARSAIGTDIPCRLRICH